ncbi:hypothetical protein ACFL1Q_01415 [Patescibacteria group bacterium]
MIENGSFNKDSLSEISSVAEGEEKLVHICSDPSQEPSKTMRFYNDEGSFELGCITGNEIPVSVDN